MNGLFKYLIRTSRVFRSMVKGMLLTFNYLRKGLRRRKPVGVQDPGYFTEARGPVTIQYPQETIPVPDKGRYRLHMETDDCIGCDKCARICPVDCITIETFRADGDLGRTSDGTMKRLHLPVFDIDMGKCMFCGLCTTVCPTECLIMTKVYDYSEFDRDNLVYHFGGMSPEEEAKVRLETEISLEKKKQEKAAAAPVLKQKPVLVRREVPEKEENGDESPEKPALKKPALGKPVIKKTEEGEGESKEKADEENQEKPVLKKPFMPRPILKKPVTESEPTDNPASETQSEEENQAKPEKPALKKPMMKRPIMKKPDEADKEEGT
ncbi:MAG: 4Fe-4S binding protein [Bacteroidia bacterium]|nr:4Fe-4S binding protein [Bacteroidia bacterium]